MICTRMRPLTGLVIALLAVQQTCWGFSPIQYNRHPIAKPMTIRPNHHSASFSNVPNRRTPTTTSLGLGKAVPAKTTLAGEIMPFIHKLFMGQSTFGTIWASLVHAVDLREFAAISAVAWGLVPLVRYFYEVYCNSKGIENPRVFKGSGWFQWSNNLSQAAKVGVFIYAADCLGVILNAMGFKYLQNVGFSHKAANISVFLWICLRIKHFKQYFLRRLFRGKTGGITKARVFDRVSDAVLYVITATIIIDRLNLEIGTTLSSLFAFGGVGTLVFSLASKDLATQLVSGFSVKGSNTFYVGDNIRLGDGTAGTVSKIGLLYTEIRGGDEIVTRIPNSQISSQRTSNISRVEKSQVKQTLWFSYDDIEKIPNVIRGIKDEIRKSCPDLITDGSRPFRVSWSSYESDHLEVEVDCRFDLPYGGKYHDTRQAVLEAIARAVRKEDVEFALPSYVAKNVDIALQNLRFDKEEGKFSHVIDEAEIS